MIKPHSSSTLASMNSSVNELYRASCIFFVGWGCSCRQQGYHNILYIIQRTFTLEVERLAFFIFSRFEQEILSYYRSVMVFYVNWYWLYNDIWYILFDFARAASEIGVWLDSAYMHQYGFKWSVSLLANCNSPWR